MIYCGSSFHSELCPKPSCHCQSYLNPRLGGFEGRLHGEDGLIVDESRAIATTQFVVFVLRRRKSLEKVFEEEERVLIQVHSQGEQGYLKRNRRVWWEIYHLIYRLIGSAGFVPDHGLLMCLFPFSRKFLWLSNWIFHPIQTNSTLKKIRPQSTLTFKLHSCWELSWTLGRIWRALSLSMLALDCLGYLSEVYW